jgi:hypothetical protein
LANLEIMIEKLAPFGTAAVTVTGSVYEDNVSRIGSHTEERQSFGAALDKNVVINDRQSPHGGGKRQNHTGFLLEATSLLRFITAFSSVDLPTLARPVRVRS